MERPNKSDPSHSHTWLKGTALTYVELAVLTLSSFAISLLLIRLMGATEFGLYKLVTGGFVIVGYLVSFGLESTISRFVAEFRSTGEYRKINDLVFRAVAIKVAALTGLFLLALVFGKQLGELFNAEKLFDDYLLVASAFISLSILSNLIGGALLVGYAMRHVVSYVRLTATLLQFAGFAVVAAAGMGIGSLVLIMALMALAQVVAYALIVAPMLVRNATAPTGQAVEPESARPRRMVRFGLYHHFWQGGQVFREFAVDSYVISAFLNITAVAHYGAAIMLPMTLQAFAPARILSGVMLPVLVRQYDRNRSFAELAVWYRLIQKAMLVTLTPFLVLSLFLTTEILELVFGDEYRVSSHAARILLVAVPFQAASYPFYILAQVINRPEFIFYSTAGGGLNLVLNLVLVPQFGISGAALATASTTVLLFAYLYLAFWRTVRFPVDYPWVAGVKTVMTVMPVVATSLVAKHLGLVHPVSLTLILLGGLAYLGLVAVSSVFDPRERALLHRNLRIPRWPM